MILEARPGAKKCISIEVSRWIKPSRAGWQPGELHNHCRVSLRPEQGRWAVQNLAPGDQTSRMLYTTGIGITVAR